MLNLKNLLSRRLLPTLKLRLYKDFCESSPQCSARNSAEDNDNLWFHHCLSKLGKDVAYLTWPFPNLHVITVTHFLSDEVVKISQPPGLSSAATELLIFSIPRCAAVCLCWLLKRGFKEPQQLKQQILRTWGLWSEQKQIKLLWELHQDRSRNQHCLLNKEKKRWEQEYLDQRLASVYLLKLKKVYFYANVKNFLLLFYGVMSKYKEFLLLYN